MEIVPYSSAYSGGVERLNEKLSAAGSEWNFPPQERPEAADELPVWIESFVAVDDQDVYGGYILKHQQFFLEGRATELGNLQMPLSLGEVESAFSHISVALLFDVLHRTPRAYSVGLGSEQTQFAKLLTAAGWKHLAIPFYFSVKSANRFALNIQLPSDRRRLQALLRALGHLRVASFAFRIRQLIASRSTSREKKRTFDEVREVARFDPSADELFDRHAKSYGLVGDRRVASLDCLYPPDDPRYVRLVVERNGKTVGWALVLDTRMREDKYFGNLRVGSLADCFAGPQDAPAVVAAADTYLARRGVDIIVSNQLHPAWCEAFEAAGYQRGPSNFFFYYSSELAETLEAQPEFERGLHVNRGDGEGPGSLLEQK